MQQALELPEDERVELAEQIWLSLKGGPHDPEWRDAWAEEIDKRLQSHEENPDDAQEWTEALAELRRRTVICMKGQ